jgi:hypothetical protein
MGAEGSRRRDLLHGIGAKSRVDSMSQEAQPCSQVGTKNWDETGESDGRSSRKAVVDICVVGSLFLAPCSVTKVVGKAKANA